MNGDELRYGFAESQDIETLRGSLLMDDDAAGVEIRRLARKYRLAPDSDLVERLDDKMLRMRYIGKRGVSVDAFGELLGERVTYGRPSTDRVIELLTHFLPLRRATRAERMASMVEQLETRNVARELVEAQQQAVITFREKTKRGTKLQPWLCECERGASLWVSFASSIDATCNRCGTSYHRKHELPTLDEAACVAATSMDEEIPF